MKGYLKDLNEKRFVFFEIGLIISLALAIWAFNVKFYEDPEDQLFFPDPESERIEQVELNTPRTQQRTFVPPANVELSTQPLSGNITTVLNQTLQETQMASTEITGANDIAIPASAFGPPSSGLPGEENTEEVEVFVIVEEMPEFPGGSEELLRYLSKNIKYPQIARENRIEGLVVVQFVIDEKGKINEPTIIRSIGGGCDEEAVRIIRGMPRWKPGIQRGIPVKVRYNVPVRFVLKTE